MGLYVVLAGFGLIFAALSSAIVSTPLNGMAESALVWGYGIAAGGGAAWIVGGGTQLGMAVIEHVVYWRLTGESLRSWSSSQEEPQAANGELSTDSNVDRL